MILVIDKTKKNAANVSDILFYMGIISKAVSISESFSEIGNCYRAAILLSPDSYPDAEDFIRRLRSYNSAVPLFAVGDVRESYSDSFAQIFSDDAYATEILYSIIEYTAKNGLPQPGDYKLAGVDVSFNTASPIYFRTTFSLTKTEMMILKYLIRTYPRPIMADEILRYSYRESKMPESANVRTHISIINKKFRAITSRNLIEMSLTTGYRVTTPETVANNV